MIVGVGGRGVAVGTGVSVAVSVGVLAAVLVVSVSGTTTAVDVNGTGVSVGGADVCVASRGPKGLKETSDAICKLGRKGTSFAVDATDEAQVEAMVTFMREIYGRIDILVNSQGAVALSPIAEFDLDAWQKVIDVNLKSLFLCCKHVGRVMLERGKGKIINISSVRGFQGRARDAAYALMSLRFDP